MEFIDSRSDAQFKWGEHDCCTLAAGALASMTGADAMQAHCKYASPVGAARVPKQAGGNSAIPGLHGLQPLASVRLAMRGDIVESDSPVPRRDGRRLISLGVCLGQVSVFAGAVGVVTRPTSGCIRAWRVA